jgi:DNA-binding NarL/FixJ family response regulator
MSDPERREGIRVLVVDDHPVFRRGLLSVLADADDIDVTAAVGTGEEALTAVSEQRPDVVLLDLNLADLNGIEVTNRLAAQGFAGSVLILTMYDDEVALIAALHAGARGYLLKGATQDEILAGIRSVVTGGMVFGSAVAATVAGRLMGLAPQRPTRALGLSERETEILSLIADGRSNTDIARTLFLSEKTVRNHITNVFSKIGVTNRVAAIERARDSGLQTRATGLPWEAP